MTDTEMDIHEARELREMVVEIANSAIDTGAYLTDLSTGQSQALEGLVNGMLGGREGHPGYGEGYDQGHGDGFISGFEACRLDAVKLARDCFEDKAGAGLRNLTLASLVVEIESLTP